MPPDEEESTVDTVTGVFENGFADIAALIAKKS